MQKAAAKAVSDWRRPANADALAQQDPHAWLEDVGGDQPLAWVREHNALAEGALGGAAHEALRARLQSILDAKERIPYVSRHGDHLYNFWRDAHHERGIWRRTTLPEYRKAAPQWETVIDLDALARDEHENWVWAGVTCLEPRGTRCLVSLSRGGGDADVVREFDLAAGAFVEGGFALPESKGSAAWIDSDTAVRRHRFRPRFDDGLRLPAHRQGMEARHAAGRSAPRVRGGRERPVGVRART
jgi:prolyl oligopeptidase